MKKYYQFGLCLLTASLMLPSSFIAHATETTLSASATNSQAPVVSPTPTPSQVPTVPPSPNFPQIPNVSPTPVPSQVPAKVKKEVTLSFAGDVTMGYYQGQSSYNRFDTVANANGLNYFFSNVKNIFEKDDLTVINLEGPFTKQTTPREKKEFNIKGDPSYVKALTGVEATNLANNHTMDYGKKGYDDTLAGLKKANISAFGEGLNSYHTVNGVRIGLIGAKGWSNGKDVKANLSKRIKEVQSKSDLVVVIFHWGDENVNYPNNAQQDLGKYAIDQGAHLVVGSHPHVTQGIEVYKGKNIVYSLGNFCFGANRNPKDKDTFIFQQTFELTDKGIVAKDSKVIPCSISSVKERNDYKPTPANSKEAERILGRLTTFSKGFNQSYFNNPHAL